MYGVISRAQNPWEKKELSWNPSSGSWRERTPF
jgi:hypothetical protein